MYFFLTCNNVKEQIEKCKNDEKILSIYNVCGRNPWLLVYESDSIFQDRKIFTEYWLNVQHWSVGQILKLDKNISNSKDENLFFIFIKGEASEEILKNKNTYKIRIEEVYNIFGEFEFVLKIYTSNLSDLDHFLTFCQEKEIVTSTKCVLSVLKEDGSLTKETIDEKRERSKKIKKNLEYSTARIMANRIGFVREEKDEQKRILTDNLKEMEVVFNIEDIEKLILDPDIKEMEYSQGDLVHPNKLIDKFSVKLDQINWLQTLLFFKASSPKNKEILEDVLQKKILGVTSSQFSRKVHYMTGDYDFMIPFDCKDIEFLTKAIDKFTEDYGELATSFVNTVCRPEAEGKGTGSLIALDIPLIESLLINSTKISEFEKTIKNINVFDPSFTKQNLIVPQEEIAPREDYVRLRYLNEDINQNKINKYFEDFESFKSLGVEPIIEFKDSSMIQVFLKFHLKKYTYTNKLIEIIKKKRKINEIIVTIYQPVRDPLTVMGLLVIKDFVELEVLFDDLRKYCRLMEFHVIFHKKYYSKVIEQSIRCKPCFFPYVTNKGCIDEYDKENLKEYSIQNCGTCIRYILPRIRNRTLNINLGEKIKKEIKISVIGVDLTLSEYFALDETLNNEDNFTLIFNNYRKIHDSSNEGNSYTHPDIILKEYNKIKDKDKFRNEYKNSVISELNNIIKLYSPDIIVFPEYTIPIFVYKEIKNTMIDHKCIIVAGSHVKNGFNLCPIIFNESSGIKYIYSHYKNNISPFEEELGLTSNMGTASLKFIDSFVGNLNIQICYDVYTSENFTKTDILLIPSFNVSEGFVDTIQEKAKNEKLVAVYANVNNKGNIKSNIFIPSKEGREASRRGIIPFHKDQWGGEIDSKEIIFHLRPQDDNLEIIKNNQFIFSIKNLFFDIIQLDIRRGTDSIRK